MSCHGGPGPWGHFGTLASRFTGTTRTVRWDQRGCGRSTRQGRTPSTVRLCPSPETEPAANLNTSDVPALCRSLAVPTLILLAATAPHRISRLVLGDIAAPPPGALHRPPLPIPDEPTPYDFAAVNAIRAQLHDPDPAWSAGMAAIAVPTLIVGGATSTFPQGLLADAVARMPEARLVTLDCGHHVHRDQPAEFLAAVGELLR